MITSLLFMLLPIVFLIHDAEEIVTRRSWMDRHADEVTPHFPWTKPMPMHLKMQSTLGIRVFTLEFSAFTNLMLTVIGIFIVAFNLVAMHRIFK